jgi:hypothetical protein
MYDQILYLKMSNLAMYDQIEYLKEIKFGTVWSDCIFKNLKFVTVWSDWIFKKYQILHSVIRLYIYNEKVLKVKFWDRQYLGQ